MNGQSPWIKRVKRAVRETPLVGPVAQRAWLWANARLFPGSQQYWETRYRAGETSGGGSYGKLALFKAETLNRFVEKNEVQSVIEFGCGDGNQLQLAKYPRYTGLDVSETALALCRERFAGDATKRFLLYRGDTFNPEAPESRAELALSLDVVYHLVEDAVFDLHMRHLFAAAQRYVIVYSSDTDHTPPGAPPHLRHRKFTAWIEHNTQGWALREQIKNPYPFEGDPVNGSFADFYIYAHQERTP